MTLRIGWFTTARGAGSRGMFDAVRTAIDAGVLDARFGVVFCNREPGEHETTDEFLRAVEDARLPLVTLSSVGFRKTHGGARSRPGEPLPAWRVAYDAEVAARLAPHPFDVGVLAGYMLIFTSAFVAQRTILNLHPALPGGPTGTWREVIRELIRSGATESGVMVHVAIPEVDAGPPAAFCRYPLRGGEFDPLWAGLGERAGELDDAALEATPLFQRIRAEQMAVEAPFLVATLAAFADGRLRTEGHTVRDARGAPAAPLDLTSDVARRMGRAGA